MAADERARALDEAAKRVDLDAPSTSSGGCERGERARAQKKKEGRRSSLSRFRRRV